MEPRMDTNKHKLIFGEEVRQIVGCAFEVLNTLGHGLLEKPYEILPDAVRIAVKVSLPLFP